MRGTDVRAITLSTLVNGEPILIGVAETRVKRQQLKLRIFWSLLVTELLLLLLVILVVRLVLGKGFQPLQEIQGELSARRPDDLSPLPLSSAPQEIAPFVRAINELLQRAQASGRAKQEFLANVAHQLRTPLAGFKTQLEWLREHRRDDTDTAQSVDLMLASTDRMVRQANQLLALARSDPGDFQPQRLGRISLDQLVSASVQQFVQQALKKNIDIGFNLQPTEVNGDSFLLRDLVDNLVDNAIRYTPPGGQVTVSCLQLDGRGVLRVEDNGPGIPDAEKAHVFERFYRLDQTQPGSGLGLAIVKDIAIDHHAQVTLSAGHAGLGTIVSVEFPQPKDPAV
jgi:two-component system sensor histidine kinase TctE